MTLWVDADSTPKEIRALLVRQAERHDAVRTPRAAWTARIVRVPDSPRPAPTALHTQIRWFSRS